MKIVGPSVVTELEGLGQTITKDLFSIKSIKTPDLSSVVVATLGNRVAVKLSWADASDGDPPLFWYAPTYLPLTSSVVWAKSEDKFAAILSHKNLVLWDGVETKLEKVEAIKLLSSVKELIQPEPGDQSEASSEDVFVVFETGHVQSLSFVLKNPSVEPPADVTILPEHGKLTRSNIYSLNEGTVLAHTIKNPNGLVIVKTFKVTAKDETEETILEPIHTFNETKNHQFLDVIHSSEEGICALSMAPDASLVCVSLKKQSERRSIALDAHVKPNSKVITASGNPDVVAILGEDGQNKMRFTLCSIKFSAVLLSEVVAKSGSKLANFGLACANQNRFFIRHDQTVSQLTISDLPRSLDCMIGLLMPKASTNGQVGNGINAAKSEASNAMQLYEQLPKLLRKKDLKAIEQILEMESDIPELLLLSIIEFLLSNHVPKKVDQVTKERLLTKAFDVAITQPLMLQYVGQLEFDTVLRMLKFLDLALKLESGEHTDKFGRLIEWTSILLNAHYANVLIMKDDQAVELLNSLRDSIASFEKSSTDFASLRPLVELIKDKRVPSQPHMDEAYSIEIWHL